MPAIALDARLWMFMISFVVEDRTGDVTNISNDSSIGVITNINTARVKFDRKTTLQATSVSGYLELIVRLGKHGSYSNYGNRTKLRFGS